MSNTKAEIFYYDIGDYLSREQKRKIIKDFKSIENIPFEKIQSNKHGDWINQRNDKFSTFIPIEPAKKFDEKSQSWFMVYSLGVNTNRDSWVYNFSEENLQTNMKKTISFYNSQVNDLHEHRIITPDTKADDFKNIDETKISWSSSLIPKLDKEIKTDFCETQIKKSMYRPFCKQNLYFGDLFIHRRGQFDLLFPTPQHRNLVICASCVGSQKGLSVGITDCIPDLHFVGDSQCFPLYWYEEFKSEQMFLFDGEEKFVRHEAVSDFILEQARTKFGSTITKEDIFYYVYGILHSKSYRETFAADLKKMLPRIPLVSEYKKFFAFVDAGRKLADLHLNYEQVSAYEGVKITGTESENFCVQQIKFLDKKDKSAIKYNDKIIISNIPQKAYEYVVNGKSAIEWIIERYAVTTDKKSGIPNNPNDWAVEQGKTRYILDLLLSIINVSVQTVDIVDNLPEVDWEEE